ncbi:hypothetical protein GP486_008550 [Trichoglossum hirsutum]|uniref:Peptidase A1 domain-containing protein n=1 Tax=Trichoglossum hirsutum TaxID=265104 RepID=A0A9P8IAN4_9PEZI|nr:hypothetical protein GP486_008550 [Trichoglossum hirsutum]
MTNITFRLQGGVDIALPYRSFDLQITLTMGGQSVRYFPLMRAEQRFVIGRVFLQEAYVIADYERASFSVSQALFPDSSVAKSLVPILSPSNSSSPAGTADKNPAKKLSPNTRIYLAVGALSFLALILSGVVFFLYSRRRRRFFLRRQNQSASSSSSSSSRPSSSSSSSSASSPLPTSAGDPTDDYLKPELDATTTNLHEAPGWRPVRELEADTPPTDEVLYELPGGELPEKPRVELPAREAAHTTEKSGDTETPPPEQPERVVTEGDEKHNSPPPGFF